ncbi:MAG TPA: sigma-70 family RNA polymerase sigma factor [Ktedonobacterales bacterium]
MQQLSLTGWGTRPRDHARRWSWRWLLALGVERISGAPEPTRATPGSAAMPSANATVDFEAFYQRHEGAIFGYLWRICSDEQTANDLTQGVFFRAWKQFERLRGYERPDAWLFRVATNLALNERRRQRTAGPTLSLVGSERAGGDHAAQLAERAALRTALESLPAKQRAAFILRESYGHSCDEIADILGLTPAAAKMTLSRARQRLRALYLKESAE